MARERTPAIDLDKFTYPGDLRDLESPSADQHGQINNAPWKRVQRRSSGQKSSAERVVLMGHFRMAQKNRKDTVQRYEARAAWARLTPLDNLEEYAQTIHEFKNTQSSNPIHALFVAESPKEMICVRIGWKQKTSPQCPAGLIHRPTHLRMG
jgi:hypothetical protein